MLCRVIKKLVFGLWISDYTRTRYKLLVIDTVYLGTLKYHSYKLSVVIQAEWKQRILITLADTRRKEHQIKFGKVAL